MQGGNLIHQLLVNGKTAGGVYDHHRITFGLGPGDCIPGNRDRILDAVFGVDRHSDAFSQNLQLLDCGRTEGVTGCQQDLHPSLAPDVCGKFRGESGLS